MSQKYLDDNGLLYFWQKIKSLFISDITFDSTNSKITKTKNGSNSDVVGTATTTTAGLMSSDDKTKLNGIPADAEENQNAFSTVRVNGAQGTPISATAKEDAINLTAGDNITFSGNASTKTIQISATDTTYTPASSVTAVGTSKTVGTSVNYARQDHVHDIALATGDSSGQVKIAGSNISVNGWSSKANLASPEFTGTPTAPTPASSSNDTTIATTAYVTSAVAAATTGAVAYQGTVPITGQTGGFAPTNTVAGWYWIVATAGTYAGQVCEAGDMIFCRTGASTYSASNFDVIQTNLDITSIPNSDIDTIVAS